MHFLTTLNGIIFFILFNSSFYSILPQDSKKTTIEKPSEKEKENIKLEKRKSQKEKEVLLKKKKTLKKKNKEVLAKEKKN